MSGPRKPRRPRPPDAAVEAPRSLLERLEAPTNPNGRAEVLAGRFGQPAKAAGAWEDRHVRWTVWVDAELRDRLQTKAKAEGRSVRALVDEALRASLEPRDP